jgi:anti-anti-sigma factor
MTSQPVCEFALELDSTSQVMVVYLTGKLDPLATEELQPRLDEAYQSGVRRFVFDLTRLTYVGSLGLRMFVGLHNRVKAEGGAVALGNPTSPVLKILDMTKLNVVLRHYPTTREAVDAVTT